jgi:hypothetical protein
VKDRACWGGFPPNVGHPFRVTTAEVLIPTQAVPEQPGRFQGRITRAGAARFVGPVVFALVLAAWCAVQLVTGTPARDLFSWLSAVTVGLLLPGTALVRAVRPARAPLIEDVGWGAAAGCLVGLTGWLADRLLPWSPGPFVWGPVVLALLLVLPVTRRRVLARPEPGWGPGPTVAMGLVMLVALAWMTTTSLRWLPLNPGATGVLYSQDTLFQAGMVGELSHHLVPDYPFVAGESLHYHWFLYAILAHLSTHTGIDPFDGSLRLGPTTVLPAVLLLGAVVARRLSGRVAAAPVAMAMLAAVDLSLANRWGWQGSSVVGGALSPIIGLWRGSPPQELAWLAGLAAMGTSVAWLRRSESDRAVPVALLVPFFIFCAGAKSSQLPVLAAGLGLALLAAVLQRRWGLATRALLLVVAAGAVFAFATVVIYRGGSYGMILDPGDRFELQAGTLFPGLVAGRSASPLLVGTAFLVVTIPLLPRLLGLVWLGARRREDPGTWIVIGACVGGFVAMYLLRHPAQSELYFMVSAYPLAVVGSAWGITLQFGGFARRLGVRRGVFALGVVGCVVLGVVAAVAVADTQPALWPLTRWARRHPLDRSAKTVAASTQVDWYLRSMAELLAVVAVLVLLVLVPLRLHRTVGRGRSGAQGVIGMAAAPVAVAVLLGTGGYGMTQTIAGSDSGSLATQMHNLVRSAPEDGVLPTTQGMVDGGRWLRGQAGPDDVIAVNRYCVETRAWRIDRSRCDARDFSVSALSQRRSYVGGWAYADRTLAVAWSHPPPYRKIPFWDPARLAAQDQAFRQPTAAGLRVLYEHGVRWLWADLRDGPVATGRLDRLAEQRYASAQLRIWQLRAP